MEEVRKTKSGKPHKCNPAHYRQGNCKKTQWEPPDPRREFSLFQCADERDWTDGTTDYWAVECERQSPMVLGLDPRNEDCRIARFRRDAATAPWHGYPITLTRKGEKFPPDILDKWEEDGIVRRGWLSKMKKRQI